MNSKINELKGPFIQKSSTPNSATSLKPYAAPLITSSIANYLNDNLQCIVKRVLEARISSPMALPKGP